MSEKVEFIPCLQPKLSSEDLIERSKAFYTEMNKRRSLRMFSDAPVPKSVMENIIMTAGTAPSGAHKQPWTFCLISNPALKSEIRKAAEQEEYESYNGRMSEAWLKDLAKFDTDWHKPFIETAPWIVVIFKKVYDLDNGEKKNNYYVNESVGIACGMLISAIHQAGLVTLTHTPSPMNFLTKLLERPANERPYLLLPVGYAADNAEVPQLTRKSLEEICISFE
jgi:iodotyrosine deiodinase